MGVPIVIWNPKRRDFRSPRSNRRERRGHRPERLEARQLLAADPIHLGVVYLETDYLESDSDVGSDSRGDRFIVSFTGGAPDTQLHELRIRTDKDGDGITVGDPIYDTELGGRGKNGAHGFELIRAQSLSGETINAVAEVSDGGQELILRLQNFRAGDRLEFTLDVDEVLRNSPDLDVFNSRLDVITSGQEFQDSILEATFHAPSFEAAQADAVFLNDFGDPASTYGIDIPADEGPDIDSRPNRSAAAVVTAQQTPKPIEISGNVWIDNDLDTVRQANEQPLANVELSLWKLDSNGSYQDTGQRATTDSNGRYEFPKSLGLLPGTYRLVQVQPQDYLSVAAIPGEVDAGNSSSQTGVAASTNELTAIEIPSGDSVASNYDFAEAERASIAGRVFVDANANDQRDQNETGIAGVTIELIPLDTLAPQPKVVTTTSADGTYSFPNLSPGQYEVVQVDQPSEYLDGADLPGTIDNQQVGVAENPGDRITGIRLNGGNAGINYDFGEIPYAQLGGSVYLAAPGQDCHEDNEDNIPLANVLLQLIDQNGEVVDTTTTNPSGEYLFQNVRPGTYRILQQTPEDLLDGSSHPGRIANVTVGTGVDGSVIANVALNGGEVGEEFNFCEVAPASVRGVVFHDRNDDGNRDAAEDPIESVTIELADQKGQVIETTQTDPSGRYSFEGLPAGHYTIVQTQPSGWLDGREQKGTVGGQSTGTVGDDRFIDVELRQGQTGSGYNFGELLPASITGRVHADLNDNCVADPNEQALAGVTVRLLDASENEVATTVTRTDGTYKFDNLAPGTYTLVQVQPDGYFDGNAKVGSAGGNSSTNRIDQISLESGQHVFAYDFCEVPPATVEGSVWQESIANQQRDPEDPPLANVSIELLDSTGEVIRRARTDSDGRYRFGNLVPGTYAIRQIQPDDLFHSTQLIGTAGGRVAGQDWITEITLTAGATATGYDFVETPPATLSGFVFQDGEPLVMAEPPRPSDVRQLRDGVRTDDDLGLEGVILQLRDASGAPIDFATTLPGDKSLDGSNSTGPVTVVTDASGYFEFIGLPAGIYHVYQVQPDGYIDGIDTPGTLGGTAINAGEAFVSEEQTLLERLEANPETDPGRDAILNVTLNGGDHSQENNFSEIVVVDPPPPPPPTPDPPPEDPDVPPAPEPELVRYAPDPIEIRRPLVEPPMKIRSVDSVRAGLPPAIMPIIDEWAVSWHLSVINGGYPRGIVNFVSTTRPVSTRALAAAAWQSDEYDSGRWFHQDAQGSEVVAKISLGHVDATALAGDFDGDGSDEAVIYVGGQWFVDINGNGVWDAEDLWVQLGTELDRPVVGDWDGDGKDDVGIFGRQWQYDPIRIPRDPGLPDPANTRRRLMEDTASRRTSAEREAEQNTDPPRLLRRNERGELRADVVDHVFKYGEQADKPVVGDWNGDGIDQVAVFNAGQWLLDEDGDGRRSEGDTPVTFGASGDLPIAGDFNGDGIDEIGIVRGQWWIIDTDGDRRLTGNDLQIQVERDNPDSQPVVADWDGDGKDEPGYYSNQPRKAAE